MPVFRPCRFRSTEYGSTFRFTGLENGTALHDHLLRVGAEFPSLILAHAARQGARTIAGEIAQALTGMGINVFMPRSPAPISALSLALANRNMPMGLYLDEGADNLWSLYPLAGHGGPVEETHTQGIAPQALRAVGVLGETDLFTPYFRALEGLLDPRPGPGPRLLRLESPFPEIEKWLTEAGVSPVLTQRNPKGPIARISGDGQGLELEYPDGKRLSTHDMVTMITQYLTSSRSTSGTVIGLTGTAELIRKLEIESVESHEIGGDPFEMSYHASFSDLLVGWAEPGIIAHQGHTPFGDALLTLGYLLEAQSE